VRATLAPALGTHRHTAAAVAKGNKAWLRNCIFKLSVDIFARKIMVRLRSLL
jgi:hypothetical protein